MIVITNASVPLRTSISMCESLYRLRSLKFNDNNNYVHLMWQKRHKSTKVMIIYSIYLNTLRK